MNGWISVAWPTPASSMPTKNEPPVSSGAKVLLVVVVPPLPDPPDVSSVTAPNVSRTLSAAPLPTFLIVAVRVKRSPGASRSASI
ncbi:MAG: hypothetical protein HND48_16670 [Chloroflexi bacterium]|nr:hypothetical protein [Chloroflexota bacterium]